MKEWKIACALLSLSSISLSSVTPAQPARSDTIVKLAGAPRYPGISRLVEELSIGAEDKGVDYQLTEIRALLPARDGTIWVINEIGIRQNGSTLRRYDASGKFLRTVAIFGQGPGEFTMPSSLAQLPDGRVLMRDNPSGSPNKILVYSEQGVFATSWTWPAVERQVRSNITTLLVDTAGTVYADLWQIGAGGVSDPQARDYSFARLDITGRLLDRIPRPDLDAAVAAATAPNEAGGSFAPSARTAWSPLGYMVTGIRSRYAIDLRVPLPTTAARGASAQRTPPLWNEGDPVISIRQQLPAIVFSAAERRDREAFDRQRALESSRGGPPPALPRVKPAFRTIVVGGDGRIWVQLSMPSEQYTPTPRTSSRGTILPQIGWREPTVYDVYEPDATFIGRVVVPYEVYLYHMKGNTAWGVARNADGVSTIKRYRIEWR